MKENKSMGGKAMLAKINVVPAASNPKAMKHPAMGARSMEHRGKEPRMEQRR